MRSCSCLSHGRFTEPLEFVLTEDRAEGNVFLKLICLDKGRISSYNLTKLLPREQRTLKKHQWGGYDKSRIGR